MGKRTNWPGAGIIYNKTYRSYFAQILLLLAVVGGGWYLINNTLANISARHIRTGYGFCLRRQQCRLAKVSSIMWMAKILMVLRC